MIDAANHAYIVVDPLQRFDAMHAGMFTRSKGAMFKTLDLDMFNNAMRKGRDNPTYLRNPYSSMIKTGHPKLAANVCAYVLRSGDDTFFARKLEELVSQGNEPSTPLAISAA